MSDISNTWNPTRGGRSAVNLHGLRRGATRVRLSLAAGLRVDEPSAIALIALTVMSAYFMLLPGVDLAISGLFTGEGGGFPLSGDPILKALRKSSSWVMGLFLVGLTARTATGLVRDRGRLRGQARRGAFLLAGLTLASGLVVNGVLKSLWGRARPVDVDVFGGADGFTAAWRFSDACQSNCSFVSGEASSAAWLVAGVVIMCPARWRRWALPAAATYGLALSLNRLAFGGHFLSDIVLSWAITALVLAVLHRLMLACPQQARRRRRLKRSTPTVVSGQSAL